MHLMPKRAPAAVVDPIVRALAAAGVTPNGLTFAALAGNVVAAALIANGALFAGGVVMLLASALDLFDGSLARMTGRATKLGALLDSTFDRVSEAAVLFGVLLYELDEGHEEQAALAFVVVVASLLVSYLRSRAGELGVPLTAGLFTRAERVVVLAVGLISGWLRLALWILAIVTVLTVLQRLYLAAAALRAKSAEGDD